MRKMNCKILAAALLAIQIAVTAMPASALACENDLVEETTQEQVEMTAEITEEAAPAEPEVIAKETEETVEAETKKESEVETTEEDTVEAAGEEAAEETEGSFPRDKGAASFLC